MEVIIDLVLAAVVDVLIGLIASYVTTHLAWPAKTSGPLGAVA
jgi:hypothetical protein